MVPEAQTARGSGLSEELTDSGQEEALASRQVLDVRVDATSYSHATQTIIRWARQGESRYVCACNVHMVMEAHDDPAFQDAVNQADLVTPDGMPLVWALRLLGVRRASRVYGPDLMLRLCAAAADHAVPVGLFGSRFEVLDNLIPELTRSFPTLDLAYAESPPYGAPRPMSDELVDTLSSSGIRILFVALGCPKQERWMAANRGKLPAVMVGVGAAFDFIARTKPQAPRMIQTAGLEWAFRLTTEPRRLWRRYLRHNPRFAVLLTRQLMESRRGK